jgi:hypothetical protein
MRTGRPPLEVGAHGKISTQYLGDGRTRAAARMRTWDGDIHRVTAVGETAADARALLERRMADRLRLSELHAWRYLTADDPFADVAAYWLDCLWDWTTVSDAAIARYRRVVQRQLTPGLGNVTIGELTTEPVERHLALGRGESAASARAAREVLNLILEFAVREGALASNALGTKEQIES